MITNKNKIYLGAVYDALRLMGQKENIFYINIKPKNLNNELILGEAFTTKGRIVKKNENYETLDLIRLNFYKKKYFKNKPIVILEANDNKVAHSGDITSLIYKNLGATGFITDGNVRDIDKITRINFPIFCNDINPIDAIDYWALTDFQCRIKINNVEINPGDMVYASNDGVIRVKKNDLKRFMFFLKKILKKENEARILINSIKKNNEYSSALKNFVLTKGRW
jgi:regulator of RNase E activity RraA